MRKYPKPQLIQAAHLVWHPAFTKPTYCVEISAMPHAGSGFFYGTTKFAAYRWAIRVFRQDLAQQVATKLRGRR